MAARWLKLCEITEDCEVQIRTQLDEEKVREYAEAMTAGEKFPRPVVFFDRLTYWLASGYHRVEAARVAGLSEIECDVRDGQKRDAALFALSDNKHGVHLTRVEKRRAVERIMGDGEWTRMTDLAIARHIGVSREFVNRVRNSYAPADEGVTKSHLEALREGGKVIECTTFTATETAEIDGVKAATITPDAGGTCEVEASFPGEPEPSAVELDELAVARGIIAEQAREIARLTAIVRDLQEIAA
ncbi:ParB/RepB/Spo0J family partition protein [Paraburkholderia ginsengisoli]|uniref:ParB/RepB/Spo0J family partition protein n=1 Tax=Paraburkholderia ginsengisoli TaxID=311231 RepID=A0A7T4N2B0_9BURK|nr:ParB/RepB/Spo0J family partition protein [Paraburkholderia ginsengisoli]QQC63864.1 ParB/RepB/Spo0J family partition protein [Paraburkholderia ginsengisoli]